MNFLQNPPNSFSEEKLVFDIENLSKITKNFGQKMVFEEKSIVILKEENMGYHSIVLSKFSILMKIDFF